MKPTPLQARMLRLLTLEGAYAVAGGKGKAWIDREPKAWPKYTDREYDEVRKAWHEAIREADLKRLRRASVEVCNREGWIAERQNGPHEWNLGWYLTDSGWDMVAMLGPEDFVDRPKAAAPETLSVAVMIDGLKDRWHSDLGWVWFVEFTPGHEVNGRRLDAMAINRRGGKYAWERMGFEIKRSRSDFRAELRDPVKRIDGSTLVDRFWFVTPAGLVEASEIPGDCGLVWVNEDGRASIKRKAPKRPEAPTGRSLIGAILTYIIDRPGQREWRKAMKEF